MAVYIAAVLIVAAIINYFFLVKSIETSAESKGTTNYRQIHAYVTVGFVLLLISASFIAYYVWIFPTFFKILSLTGILHCALFFYVWVNISFNYLAVVCTSPGKGFTLTELDEEGYSADDRPICGKCRRLKCQGTFHCKVCTFCVRMFSHHSYLANNCIGLNNFSYFYLLLWYSFLGELYGIWLLREPFKTCTLHMMGEQATNCGELGDSLLLFPILLVAFISTSYSLSFHTTLLKMDVSPKDFSTELRTSPTYYGFAKYLCCKIFKRKLYRHRIKHLLCERKPQWKHLFLPSLNEPPIDLSAEDIVDYELESEHMV